MWRWRRQRTYDLHKNQFHFCPFFLFGHFAKLSLYRTKNNEFSFASNERSRDATNVLKTVFNSPLLEIDYIYYFISETRRLETLDETKRIYQNHFLFRKITNSKCLLYWTTTSIVCRLFKKKTIICIFFIFIKFYKFRIYNFSPFSSVHFLRPMKSVDIRPRHIFVRSRIFFYPIRIVLVIVDFVNFQIRSLYNLTAWIFEFSKR